MKRRFLFLPLLSLPLAAACGGGEETQVVTTSGFDFRVPMDLQPVNTLAIDSVAGELIAPTMRLVYDFGSHAGKPVSPDGGDVDISLLSIDGRNAYVEYFVSDGDTDGLPYIASLYIEDAGGGNRLAMVARSTDEDGFDRAKAIFRSVDFAEAGES